MKDKMIINESEFKLELQDNEWEFEYVDHDRQIARAIVFDDLGYFYFVRAIRNDDFGKATLIETAGGGVELEEELTKAVRRELKEELGIEVNIVCKIGVVSDYYNLIHRHNINNYYLCKVSLFGEKNLTQDEVECFHLSTLKMTLEEFIEYVKNFSKDNVLEMKILLEQTNGKDIYIFKSREMADKYLLDLSDSKI